MKTIFRRYIFMKSIKPGRGPSMMGFFSCIFGIVFSIAWTVTTVSMRAPILFPIFGIGFTIMMMVSAIYNYKNAKGKNRYSSYDIVNSCEEPDPFNEKYGTKRQNDSYSRSPDSSEVNFCPYCGSQVGNDHIYCTNCGKKVK